MKSVDNLKSAVCARNTARLSHQNRTPCCIPARFGFFRASSPLLSRSRGDSATMASGGHSPARNHALCNACSEQWRSCTREYVRAKPEVLIACFLHPLPSSRCPSTAAKLRTGLHHAIPCPSHRSKGVQVNKFKVPFTLHSAIVDQRN